MRWSTWLLGIFVGTLVACGGDDDSGTDSANDDDNCSMSLCGCDGCPGTGPVAQTSTSAGSGGGSGAGTAGSDGSSGAGTTAGAGGCVEAGGTCSETDYCNSWSCLCMNSGTEFMTIGSCDAGMCSTDGNAVCENICAPNGGVMMATDLGCQ